MKLLKCIVVFLDYRTKCFFKQKLRLLFTALDGIRHENGCFTQKKVYWNKHLQARTRISETGVQWLPSQKKGLQT